MGFLDKAKAAANELAAKADTAMANSGLTGPGGPPGTHAPDKLLRDLGVLTWLELNGRPQPEGERDRVIGALREAEGRGALGPLTLQTAPPPPSAVPPPPGAAAAQASTPPPAPGQAAAPPPPGAAEQAPPPEQPPVPASDPSPSRPSGPTAPPPPPPSWAQDS